jgi:hypothetical protein
MARTLSNRAGESVLAGSSHGLRFGHFQWLRASPFNRLSAIGERGNVFGKH